MVGVVGSHKGSESGAAYGSTDLHPRMAPTGRYAAPFRPYVYRGYKGERFQKRENPVTIEGPRPESPEIAG